jgi:polyhydroxyalkanoate synthesis repressor PhaR
MIVKKYSNRRLYDTEESRYMTLEELAEKVRAGRDVTVIDAKTGEDLTQATLLQIILETRAARLLPVSLLSRLIRLQDEALGEFFSRYVSLSLDMYLGAKQNAQALSPYLPLSTLPFSAGNALARLLNASLWSDAMQPAPQAAPVAQHTSPSPPPPPHDPEPDRKDDLAELRGEIAALRKELRRKKR